MSSRSEEEYFKAEQMRKREKQREQAERRAAEEKRRREIAGSLGTDDEALVERIHALGVDGAAAEVLHLLPLVHVAWADGAVSEKERMAIMQAVQARGIEPGSPPADFMASLLEKRPSDTLMNEILSIVRDVLEAKGLNPDSVLSACGDVAEASGGLFGFGVKVSHEEREAIERIGATLKADQQKL